MRPRIHPSFGLLLLAPAALANTFVVDAAGGPGVDFTQISAAVAAANPGDRILVRSGDYGGFTVSKGVAILGIQHGVHVQGAILVTGVPAGPRVTLSRLFAEQLEIDGCTAPVVATVLVIQGPPVPPAGYEATLEVRDAVDVRLRSIVSMPQLPSHRGAASLLVESARVEVVQSNLLGRDGLVGTGPMGGTGYPGIDARAGAEVHASSCVILGGSGGPSLVQAGAGAPGISVAAGARVIVTGENAYQVTGGVGSLDANCTMVSAYAPGIWSDPANPADAVRVSGVTIQGASTFDFTCGSATAPAVIGAIDQPATVDPALIVSGLLAPGTPAVYTVRGVPGAAVQLRVGRQLAVVDLPGVVEDRLLVPLRTFDLGILPASCEAFFTLTLPSTLPSGSLILAQATSTDAQGATRLSQSVAVVLQ